MKIKILFLMLFLFSYSHALIQNVTLFCIDADGETCDATTTCNATIQDESFITQINNTQMSFIINGYYNITVDLSIGTYPSFARCEDSVGRVQSVDLTFQIGDDMVFETATILGFSVISFLLFFVGKTMKNENFQFLFLGIGMFTMTLLAGSILEIATISEQGVIQSNASLALLAIQAITLLVVVFFFLKILFRLFEQLQSLNKIGKGKEEEEDLADEVL